MGVPTFYRWLVTKYPKVPKDAVEVRSVYVEQTDEFVPADLTEPNANGMEFDNLYIDMNGVVHPCCHPEDCDAPSGESEMFQNVSEYIDRIVNIVRPRKLLFLALDGVAPRAKMNQQRSRRYKAAAEADAEEEAYNFLKKKFEAEGREIAARVRRWDSNVITPGTQFMDRLASVLRHYVATRMSSSTYWAGLTVLLSDSNTPGEGEHKIMEFVRNQRQLPGYDPNTRHCIHGMDADLIMLALATHELHFYIIREIVTDGPIGSATSTLCTKCGMQGHPVESCPLNEGGGDSEAKKEKPKVSAFRRVWKPLQFLQIPVLREYLGAELELKEEDLLGQDPKTGSLKKRDNNLERKIDDFILICFFIGNDFLPHLNSLSIQKGSIDQMLCLYKAIYPVLGDYLTCDGFINFDALNVFLKYLALVEPLVLQSEYQRKARYKNNDQNRGQQSQPNNVKKPTTSDEPLVRSDSTTASSQMSTQPGPSDVSVVISPFVNQLLQDDDYGRSPSLSSADSGDESRKRRRFDELGSSFAADIDDYKAQLKEIIQKRACVDDPEDLIGLGTADESGYRQRYYRAKFHLDVRDDVDSMAANVAKEYLRGVAWVLKYYFHGVPSWEWYYPYHFSPLAKDIYELGFTDMKFLTRPFKKGNPFKPLEQLLAVLPPRSSVFLPDVYSALMVDPNSPLADFYPVKFKEDPDGKRYRWQWVALLPFIDPIRLRCACNARRSQLPPESAKRDEPGQDLMFAAVDSEIAQIVEQAIKENKAVPIKIPGLNGTLAPAVSLRKGQRLMVDVSGFEKIRVKCHVGHFQPASPPKRVPGYITLPHAVPPPSSLTPDDLDMEKRPLSNRFNSKTAQRMILSVIGGKHYEQFLALEAHQREANRRYIPHMPYQPQMRNLPEPFTNSIV